MPEFPFTKRPRASRPRQNGIRGKSLIFLALRPGKPVTTGRQERIGNDSGIYVAPGRTRSTYRFMICSRQGVTARAPRPDAVRKEGGKALRSSARSQGDNKVSDGQCGWEGTLGYGAQRHQVVLRPGPASVGRKSVAHSAFPQARAYFAHPRLSPQSGSGRNLLYGEPARPQFGSVGGADRYIARRGSPGAHPRTLPHRRLGRPSRSYALPMDFGLGDLAARRCRLPRSVARNQNRIRKVFASRRVAITDHDQARRTGYLAAPLLGAHYATIGTLRRTWTTCISTR